MKITRRNLFAALPAVAAGLVLEPKGFSILSQICKAGDYIQERRENQTLKCVNSDNEAFAAIPFGGKHDFRTNILEWNENNLKNKFSWMVITSKSYND